MTTLTARAAAEAGTTTRDRTIRQAFLAHDADAERACVVMPADFNDVTSAHIAEAQLLHDACSEHLRELARLIAQRDGYAAAQSIGPDVALPNRRRASMSGEGRWR